MIDENFPNLRKEVLIKIKEANGIPTRQDKTEIPHNI